MGTPFTTSIARPSQASTAPASLQRLASHKQVEFVGSLINQRDWRNGPDSYVRRISVIAATLYIAEQVGSDAKMADQLKIELFDRHDVTGTFHQLMDFSFASAVNDERDPRPSKPLTTEGASALIDYLKGLPTKVAERATAASQGGVADVARNDVPSAEVVPAGRYAVKTNATGVDSNDLGFYKVDRPTEGRWAGRVFVKMMLSDEEQRLSWATSRTILAKIAEVGAEQASAAYGLEFKHCGVCGRGLTNKVSRDRGIGPDCAEKMGW